MLIVDIQRSVEEEREMPRVVREESTDLDVVTKPLQGEETREGSPPHPFTQEGMGPPALCV